MNINVRTDYAHLPVGRGSLLRIMLTMAWPGEVVDESSRPLNLMLVLDRSGSMAGIKMSNMLEAVQQVFAQLKPEDMLGIVAYSDRAEVVMAPSLVGQAQFVAECIGTIRPGGMTCLSEGYELGATLAEEHHAETRTSRIMLLSDGLANRGETRPGALGDMTEKMRQRGLSTSTIGFGAGYNEELMGLMAEHGGGNAHFIESPGHAASVFAEELGYINQLAARGVTVTYHPSPLIEACTQLNAYNTPAANTYVVGEVYQRQRKSLVLEVQVTAPEPGTLSLGHMVARWQPVVGDVYQPEELVLPLAVKAVPVEQWQSTPPDREVTIVAALLACARAKREAIRLADKHRYDDAADLLQRCAEELTRLNLADSQVTEEIEDLRTRAERLRHERHNYYDVMERKRMFHEFDKGSKGQQHSVAAMRERRGSQQSPHARPGGRYPCFMQDGHPVAETEQGMVLLDTGAAQSFGSETCLRLFGRDFPLSSNYLGQTIEEISALVGTRFFALIGADVLNKFPWTLDMVRGEFRHEPYRNIASSLPLQLEYFNSIPKIRGKLPGGPRQFVFDTCARVSYLKREHLANSQPSGEAVDFFPGFGPFSTQTFEIPFELAGTAVRMRFGVLPPTLERVLDLASVSGIIGASLLDQYKVHYSAADKMMYLHPCKEWTTAAEGAEGNI